MTFVLQRAAAAATPTRPVLPYPRRVVRDVLRAAAAQARGLAARVEKADAPPRPAVFPPTRAPRRPVRSVEAAVLVAVAVYFAAGVVAVLSG